MLDELAAEAELELLDLCRRNHAVGYDGRRPIVYPYLTPPLPLPARSDHPDLSWSRRPVAGPRTVCPASSASQTCASRATRAGSPPSPPSSMPSKTSPRSGRACPRTGGRASPGLDRRAVPRDPDGASPAPEPVPALASDFTAFCDRWGLIGIATWDLPLPQGPLLPSPLPAGAPALPVHGVHLILPVHYPLKGDDDLLELILGQQRALAEELGLDSAVAGLPHHRIYASILEVVHLERTITHRYAGARRPRGLRRRPRRGDCRDPGLVGRPGPTAPQGDLRVPARPAGCGRQAPGPRPLNRDRTASHRFAPRRSRVQEFPFPDLAPLSRFRDIPGSPGAGVRESSATPPRSGHLPPARAGPGVVTVDESRDRPARGPPRRPGRRSPRATSSDDDRPCSRRPDARSSGSPPSSMTDSLAPTPTASA